MVTAPGSRQYPFIHRLNTQFDGRHGIIFNQFQPLSVNGIRPGRETDAVYLSGSYIFSGFSQQALDFICRYPEKIAAKKSNLNIVTAGGFKFQKCIDLFPDTRSYDGCIDLYATRNMDDPQTFVIVETWESREKYEKYFNWRVETGVIEQMNGMLVDGTELNLRFFDRIGV